MISTRQGMLRKYLLVCRHLMNKLELESFGKLCRPVFWVDQALTEFDNFVIFDAAATEKTKICRDKNSSF